MMKSGYPTMLYMASACDQAVKRTHEGAAVSSTTIKSKAMWQTDLTFSFAALLVSESIQPTDLRFSSNADLISATISSTWGMQRQTAPYRAHVASRTAGTAGRAHSQWPCYPQQRCLWQTWLPQRSLKRCLCHWHIASSVVYSSGRHQKNTGLLKKGAASDPLTVITTILLITLVPSCNSAI